MNHLKASKILYSRMFIDSRITVFVLSGGTSTSYWHQDSGVRTIQGTDGVLEVHGVGGESIIGTGENKVTILDSAKSIQIMNSGDTERLFILEETFRTDQPVISLDKSEVHREDLVVYKFEASWCGPCQDLKPQWQQFTKQFPKIKFQIVDVDNDTLGLSQKFQVTSMPTFVLTEGSVEVGRVMGACLPKVKSLIDNHL